MRLPTLISACALTAIVAAGSNPSVDSIVSRLTLEEKVNLVVGTQRDYVYWPEAAPGMPVRVQGDTDDPRGATAFTEGRVTGAAGDTYDLSSKGLPPIVMADGPAGVRIDAHREGEKRTYFCTAFPCATLLAASWDTDAVERTAAAIGDEARRYGVDILLAPAMNIMRSPLCGRNFEYYSEDPVLTGYIAAAYVNGVQSNGVGATLKHFAANNQETMRNGIDVVVSDRALRDIYLEGFRIAVKESKPLAVMTAYNSVNGSVMPENKHLLTDILRGEWGFDGFVMTDWWAEGNGARQLAAGNDMLMPGTWRQYDEIMDALRDGSLSEEQLNRNVAAIVEAALKLPAVNGMPYDNKPDLKAHAALARDMASRGMVLLENRDATLPLCPGIRVALFGNGAYDTFVGGTGSGNVNRAYKIDFVDGLANAGLKPDRNLRNLYSEHIRAHKASMPDNDNMWTVAAAPEAALEEAVIVDAARNNDVAIVTISRMAGESADRTLTPGDWFLSDVEKQNLENVCNIFQEEGKPTVVVLNMGSIVEMASWRDLPDAILHAWLPGQEAGNALADILTGKVNPSGRLPMTIAVDYRDYGSAPNFPHSENRATVYYTDDIFVGYRHFDKNYIYPLYPFGSGMSYTIFNVSDPEIAVDPDGSTQISVTVENVDMVPGSEVVGLYAVHPADNEQNDGVRLKINGSEIEMTVPTDPTHPVMPKRELKNFAKTKVLQPGESQRIVLKINP